MQVHLTVPARGAQAEKAADAGQYAASHKKRRSSAAAVQASGKKQKMASVQALHTEHVTQARSSSISQHSALDTTDADTDSAGQAREPSATPEAASHVASAVTTDDTAAEDVTPAHSKAAPQPDQKQKGEGLQQTALDMDQDSLHASTAAATDAKGGKQTGSHLTDVKEYLVKWKGKSYMHCTWVRHDDVVKMGKQSTGLKSRLRHFLQNNTAAQVHIS